MADGISAASSYLKRVCILFSLHPCPSGRSDSSSSEQRKNTGLGAVMMPRQASLGRPPNFTAYPRPSTHAP